MTTQITQTVATAYAPPASKQQLIAEAIGCIISGRPYPEHLRATTYVAARPATVEAGIREILRGRPAAPCH